MSDSASNSRRPLESFRPYLRLLAGAQVPGNLRGRIDPSDIVHDTLLRAHERFDQYRGTSEAQLAAWLRQILANAMIDALRRVNREPRLLSAMEQSSARLERALAPDDSSPSAHVERQEALERLAQALERLPDDQRIAIQLQQIHNCSVEEIARQMNRTKDAVGGLLKRGMRRLRELMTEGREHE